MNCPDCGQPMHRHIRIDVYAVIAHWLIASDNQMAPPGVTAEGLADYFREHLEWLDKPAHDRLYAAARAVLEYVEQQVMAQSLPVAGHA